MHGATRRSRFSPPMSASCGIGCARRQAAGERRAANRTAVANRLIFTSFPRCWLKATCCRKWRIPVIKERVSTMLCCGALLLSTALGNAQDVGANSFRCITKMTPVRQFYVDNLRGNLDATLAAANSPTGAVYPPGSVIQLIPTEAMVKRDRGFNAATHDWEFFELDVSKDGTQIRKRGTTDVVNRFGGNCFDCHVPAAAQWDLVCETD